MEAHAPSRPPLGPPMVELDFTVRDAAPVQYAAIPTLGFELAIASLGEEPVRSVALDVQIQIGARRRSYSEEEQLRLGDLFGEPAPLVGHAAHGALAAYHTGRSRRSRARPS